MVVVDIDGLIIFDLFIILILRLDALLIGRRRVDKLDDDMLNKFLKQALS